MKNVKHTIILSVLLLIGLVPANAQYDETNNLFYHAQRAPQSNLLNPAFFPNRNTFYLTLPTLDFSLGLPLALNDLAYVDKANQITVINIDSIFNKLNDNNQFRFGFDLNVLGFGLKIKNLFIDANVRLVNRLSIGIPISVVNLLMEGNMIDMDTPNPEINIVNGDLFNFNSYLETSIGGGYHISPINLTIGAHVKLLSGLASIQTDKTSITLETDNNLEYVRAHMYYQLQAGAFFPYDTSFSFNDVIKTMRDDPRSILNSLFDNTGFAFDLGAKWEIGPLALSVALRDISPGIHWKKNVHTIHPETEGILEYSGLDFNSMLNNGTFSTDSLTSSLQEFLDAMKNVVYENSGDYYAHIPAKIDIGASITLLQYLRAGLLFHGQLDRGFFPRSNATAGDAIGNNFTNTFRWNTTLSLSLNLFNWAEFILGSSIVYDGQNMDFFNPGAGIILSTGTALQTYFMADYVSSIHLTQTKAFNIKAGTNILLGKGGKKKKSTPFLPDIPLL